MIGYPLNSAKADKKICTNESRTDRMGRLFENLDGNIWLSSKEAAVYLGISEKTLRNMCSNGEIPHSKLGRLNRYLLKDLIELLDQSKRGGKYGY